MKSLIAIVLLIASTITADDDFVELQEFHTSGVVPMIINGTVSEHIPYMASIRLLSEEISHKFGYGHYCAGVFVSQKHILTLASCLQRPTLVAPEELQIIAGSRYRYDESEAKRFTAEKIEVHPDYAISSLPHNVAVITLSAEVSLDESTIYPITISKKPAELNEAFLIFGWGTPLHQNGSRVLLTGRISVVERETCPQNFIHRFCAGPRNYGGCDGDDGGAVVANGTLFGLVDYRSLEYCEEAKPSHLYIDVVSYRDWIAATVNRGSSQLVSTFVVAVAAFSTLALSS